MDGSLTAVRGSCNTVSLCQISKLLQHFCNHFGLREDVDLFFKTLDRDFDGRLTLEEFMGEETPIEKLFKLMDKNRDGFITKKVWKITSIFQVQVFLI